MSQQLRRLSSVHDHRRKSTSKPGLLDKQIHLSGKQLTLGIVIGVCLTIVTIILQCVAFFTPHWKEVSPKTHSLYVDDVDALIRTDVLVYFNAVHRFTRHSYGLFQRCEYPIRNSSQVINVISTEQQTRHCTKNFLPTYADDQFDTCHSLEYYRFCSKTNTKVFDVINDYLRTAFDIKSSSSLNLGPTSSCDCHYPTYIRACHVLGVFVLIFLFLTAVLFGIFPFLKDPRVRLKVKLFGVLSWLLATLFLLINLLVVLDHFEYESVKYLSTIERHYQSSQIYQLSQDAKKATSQFLSSITIRIGYSTMIAWLAFVLSIIDGMLLMITCKIVQEGDVDKTLHFEGIPLNSPQISTKIDNENNYPLAALPLSKPDETVLQQPLSAPPPLPPAIIITDSDKKSKTRLVILRSCLKQAKQPHTHLAVVD